MNDLDGTLDTAVATAPRAPASFRDVLGRLRHFRPPGERLDDGVPIAVAPVVRADTAQRRLAGFDLRSVASVTARFVGYVIVIVMCAVFVFWALGSIFGIVGAFEEFMRGIGFTGFHLLSIPLLLGFAFVAVVIGASVVGMTVVAAALYNVLANQHGGVRVFVSDDDFDPMPTPTGQEHGAVHTNGNGNGTNGNGTNGNGRKVRKRAAVRSDSESTVHTNGIGFGGVNVDDLLKPVIGVGQAPARVRRLKRRRPPSEPSAIS